MAGLQHKESKKTRAHFGCFFYFFCSVLVSLHVTCNCEFTGAPVGIIGEEDAACDVGLQEFRVHIHEDLTLTLLQAPTAHTGVLQHDETGTVVWGASVCLSRFLSPALVRGRSVLELGCGCGLPSLVATHYQAESVVATDLEDATLQQLDQVARLNHLSSLELVKLDWNHHPNNNEELEQADIILASDVIYHEVMVEPFVKTIDRYLSPKGKAYLALRNTRQGVSTLWQEALPKAGFQLAESISCQGYLKESDNTSHNEAIDHRFRGDHTIYVFQRQKEEEA